MRLSQRVLIVALMILAVIFIAAYIYLDAILDTLARQLIGFIAQRLAQEEVLLKDWGFNKVSISFPSILSLQEFSSVITLPKLNEFRIENNFFMTVKSVSLLAVNILKGEFAFDIDGASVLMHPEVLSSYESIKKTDKRNELEITSQLRLPFRIDIFHPKETVSSLTPLFKGFSKFVRKGVTDLTIDFSGISKFVVEEKWVKGRLLLAPYGKEKKIVMNEDDFKKISEVLEERLTEDEYGIYCNNPLRMPRMLEIRNYASSQAWAAHERDDSVPEEAYKHILWAYVLAVTYDQRFSQEVTDSHEINAIGRSELAVRTYLQRANPDKGKERTDPNKQKETYDDEKTKEETQMDLINNKIGREYALKGYPEDKLLSRMLLDPRVVRDYRELKDGNYEEVRNDVKTSSVNNVQASALLK